MKFFLTAFLFLFLSHTASAQLEKTIHQVFEVGENQRISLNLAGEVTLVPWAGNTIMTETKVELHEASPSILKHFIEVEQRYAIESESSSDGLLLYSHDQERKEIRTRTGICPEIVHVRVFIPDEFEKQGENTLVKTD